MVIVVKGGGRASPTLTSQANFTLITECTPESGCYHSVYSVVYTTTLYVMVDIAVATLCTVYTTDYIFFLEMKQG